MLPYTYSTAKTFRSTREPEELERATAPKRVRLTAYMRVYPNTCRRKDHYQARSSVMNSEVLLTTMQTPPCFVHRLLSRELIALSRLRLQI
jgi:hypothetical protein